MDPSIPKTTKTEGLQAIVGSLDLSDLTNQCWPENTIEQPTALKIYACRPAVVLPEAAACMCQHEAGLPACRDASAAHQSSSYLMHSCLPVSAVVLARSPAFTACLSAVVLAGCALTQHHCRLQLKGGWPRITAVLSYCLTC